MAPEQGTGERDIDHRVDVWALGVVLYECLSGARPIEGDSLGQVIVQLLNTGIAPLCRVAPHVPEELGALADRMLARDRHRRPADLREMAEVLARHSDLRVPAFGAPGSEAIEKDARQLPYIMSHPQYDLFLLDMNFSPNANTGVEGFEWLDFILDKKQDQKVGLFTAFGDIEMAVRAIKNGASDFLLKPWENDKLLATIMTILDVEPKPKQSKSAEIIGQCPEMLKVLELVSTVSPTDANVLILGENGTGKDLLAKEIHHQSKRGKKPFVHTDLGAISESLFESEIFGHIKGAFTDAREDRKGRLQEADGGTLFLDEIGNIPMTQQSKLLYALQNGSFIKVGSNQVMKFDARLICATNEDIYKRIEDKTFRQDLLYRINSRFSSIRIK